MSDTSTLTCGAGLARCVPVDVDDRARVRSIESGVVGVDEQIDVGSGLQAIDPGAVEVVLDRQQNLVRTSKRTAQELLRSADDPDRLFPVRERVRALDPNRQRSWRELDG